MGVAASSPVTRPSLPPALAFVTLLVAACTGPDASNAAAPDAGPAQDIGDSGPNQAADASPTETSGPLVARIMSFNLRWDGFDDGDNAWVNRKAIVYQVLTDFAPDSVGTQEPMPRQIADIEEAIPTLDSFQFDDGAGFDRTQQILYDNTRLQRTEASGFLLVEGTNEGGYIRFCTWVRVTDQSTGRSYYHYNVHLDHRDAASRELSVVRLMKHIADRSSNAPFVVTGDFNTGEASPTMNFLRGEQALLDGSGESYTNPIPLVDTYRALYPDAPNSGTGSGFSGKQDGGKIDHVLVQAGAATISDADIVHTNVDGQYPSDHFPVTAVIEWP